MGEIAEKKNNFGVGKHCKYGEKAKNTTFKLYSWEVEKVKAYIRQLRIEYDKNNILLK